MAYRFKLIQDGPFWEKSQKEYGYAESVSQGGKHNEHEFKDFGMTNEQLDALRHTIMKNGIDYEDIKKQFVNLNQEEINKLKHIFISKVKMFREVKYYYSKALFKKFPNPNSEGQTLEHGIILIDRIDFIMPVTWYTANPKTKPTELLEKVFISIKGIVDDTEYIENAIDNSYIEMKESISGDGRVFTNNTYNPKMDYVAKELFKNEKVIEKISKYNDLENFLNILIKTDEKLDGFTLSATQEIKRRIKKYVDECGNSLHPSFKNLTNKIKD